MSEDLDAIYSREWFEHDFEHLQGEFTIAAEALDRIFDPECAVDVGAGPGMIVRALRMLGVNAVGIDGSVHAYDYADASVRPYLAIRDIRDPSLSIADPELFWGVFCLSRGPFDLVVCTEVAEHLEAQHAPRLVELLTGSQAPWIVFTAAGPGQEGNHHVNCQPALYWIRLMLERGYCHDAPQTERLKRAWYPLRRLSHMTRNVLVFAKAP